LNVRSLLQDLVAINSVNASLGGPGEEAVGEAIAEVLRSLGAKVDFEPVPGNAPNVLGTLPGPRDAPVVLLESHMDTVPLPPGHRPGRHGDRLTGRGTCDTKASAVAMLAAVERLTAGGQLPATLVFAGVVDEEATMQGAAALPAQLGRVDAAVIGEPTSLRPIRANNGFARIRIRVGGVAAHSSKAYLGRNALISAARVAVALEERLLPRLVARSHPLTGPALITPTVLQTGTAPNVVPDRAELIIDRRIAPGEDPDAAVGELDELLDELRNDGHDITRDPPAVILAGVETPSSAPIVQAALAASRRAVGADVTVEGVPYSTDACRLGIAGIPSVVLGPGSIDQAHTVDEWVDLTEVERCVDVYEDTVRGAMERLAEAEDAP
jgi:succinyl-diaminopimelate desuccinylase